MIPEHRLALLFDKVQQYQINQCTHHSSIIEPSLYYDHSCDRADFPLAQLTELDDNTGEVWYLTFSPSGSYLATAAHNNAITIYSTSDWHVIRQLVEQAPVVDPSGISFLSWSPDESHLISCSLGHQATVYNIKDSCRKVQSIDGFDWPVGAAAWLPDGKSFIIGSHDPNRALELYNLGNARPIHAFIPPKDGLRIRDCKVSADGSKLVAMTVDKRVRIYDLLSTLRPRIAEHTMDDYPTCMDLSADGSQLLLSMCNSQLRIIDAASGNLVQRFQGQKQANNVIRAAFGGAGQNYIITGSEDSHVYIHRRHSGAVVAAFPAHGPHVVNAVAWHPTRMGIFASGGDDHKVIM